MTPPASTPPSVPTQFASSLNNDPPPSSSSSSLSPAARYALDALIDVFTCTNTNTDKKTRTEDTSAHGNKGSGAGVVDDEVIPVFSSEDVRHFLQAATSSSSSSSTLLPPALAMIHAAFLGGETRPQQGQAQGLGQGASFLGSPSFLLHFITSSTDPELACSATELAAAVLSLLRMLLVHPALLAALKQDQDDLKGAAGVYGRLCAASAQFARDLFQHTLHALSSASRKHGLAGVSKSSSSSEQEEKDEEQSEEGPFRSNYRRPLGEISLSVHNEPPRQGQDLQQGRGRSGSSVKLSAAEALRLVWEPVFLAHVRLLQHCTHFAALTATPSDTPTSTSTTKEEEEEEEGVGLALIACPYTSPTVFEARRRQTVADWVHSSSSSSSNSGSSDYEHQHPQGLGLRRRHVGHRSGSESECGSGGEVLAEACRQLAHSHELSLSHAQTHSFQSYRDNHLVQQQESRAEASNTAQCKTSQEAITTAAASSALQLLSRFR